MQFVRDPRHPKCVAVVLAALLWLLPGCRGTSPANWKSAGLSLDTNQRLFWGKQQALWNDWASKNLQSGDLVFILGESRILMGLVNFSKLCTEVADSDFSHVAVVSRENGEIVVYDTVMGGPRRVPFDQLVGDRRVWRIAVKRLRPDHQRFVPEAIAYCRQAYESQTEFDDDFRLNNDRLYCTELVELAFRHAGLPLSDPIPINQLPGYDRVSEPVKRIVQTATSIQLDQQVFVPGNETIGIWANPSLERVLDVTDVSTPPQTDRSGGS